jgi:ubiquinone/menaquinone biosynthesis C-methylase UbiE
MPMALLIPPRLDQPELLDEHDTPRADMERSLLDLRRFNRYLGGQWIYRRLLRRFRPVRSVLDVGAGSADCLEGVRDASSRIALDFKIDHLLYSSDPSIRRVVGDAARLPFRESAVDVVTSSHFFHHFTAEENTAILREALRVAAKGVAVNDTRRHYAPLVFVRLLGALNLVGRITRFDAPASVLRGYTAEEARAIARRVGAKTSRVIRAFPYRFGILLWK